MKDVQRLIQRYKITKQLHDLLHSLHPEKPISRPTKSRLPRRNPATQHNPTLPRPHTRNFLHRLFFTNL